MYWNKLSFLLRGRGYAGDAAAVRIADLAEYPGFALLCGAASRAPCPKVAPADGADGLRAAAA